MYPCRHIKPCQGINCLCRGLMYVYKSIVGSKLKMFSRFLENMGGPYYTKSFYGSRHRYGACYLGASSFRRLDDLRGPQIQYPMIEGLQNNPYFLLSHHLRLSPMSFRCYLGLSHFLVSFKFHRVTCSTLCERS